MAAERYLIVNADDFGQSPGINRGIIEAHKRGVVTSASLMTRWLAAGEAALYARQNPALSLGLHLDFGEWIYRDESWVPLYRVVPLEDAAALEREISRQLETFRFLIGRDPSHINSHQYIHLREPVRTLTLQLCRRLGIPLRSLCPGVHYFARFYGQTMEGRPLPEHLALDWLIENLSMFPDGLTVLVCHPGYASDLETPYRMERLRELEVLCNPRLRAAIRKLDIRLCSFEDWKCFSGSRAPLEVG